MHPIQVDCWDRYELISYFILKPKASVKIPLNIDVQPIIEKETTVTHIKDAALQQRNQLL